MQTTFSTTFILRSSRTRDGLTPIYCRITVSGSRSEFSIKRSVTEKSWDAGKVKGNSEEARSINSYLKQVEAKIFEHYRDLLADDKLVTADGLKKIPTWVLSPISTPCSILLSTTINISRIR